MTTRAITMQDLKLSGNAKGRSKDGGNDGFGNVFTLASDVGNSNHVAFKNGMTSKNHVLKHSEGVPLKMNHLQKQRESSQGTLSVDTSEKDGFTKLDETKKLFISTGDKNATTDSGMEEYVSRFEEGIGDILKDVMDMEEEDGNRILEKLGIGLMDLFFNPDALRQFILEANGATDAIEFLTNEPMLNEFNQILSMFQELKQYEGFDDMVAMGNDQMVDSTFDENLQYMEDSGILDFQEAQPAEGLPFQPQGTEETSGMDGKVSEGIPERNGNGSEANPTMDGKESGEAPIMDESNDIPNGNGRESAGMLEMDGKDSDKNETEDIKILVEKDEGDTNTIPIREGNHPSGNPSGKQSSAKDEAFVKSDADTESPTSMLDAFVQNLTGKTVDGSSVPTEQAAQMREIVTQVVEQIKIFMKPDQTGMEITLNPEHLGKVSLSVVMKEGVATANFLVQNEMVKEALQSQIQSLRENLEQQGLKVEAIEVNVSEFGFEQSNHSDHYEAQQSKGKRNLRNMVRGLHLNDLEDEEIDSPNATTSNPNGGLIDFIA